jgi:hypothetical protein
MSTSKVFQAMHKHGLIDWGSLAAGWNRHWVTKSDVVGWAVYWLEEHPDETSIPISQLAGGESLDDEEISFLFAQVSPPSESLSASSLDKWRLVMLIDLAESDLSWDEKVTQLECLQAEFAYPNDMRDCTRYGGAGVDPLEAANAVIDQLKARWHVP